MIINTIKEYEDINKLIFDNFLYYKNNLLNKIIKNIVLTINKAIMS